LLGDNGKYLTRCSNCTQTYDNYDMGAAVDSKVTERSKWFVAKTWNNTIALQADSGKWLTRCDNCLRNPRSSTDYYTAGVHGTS
jgi:hypothetical protein